MALLFWTGWTDSTHNSRPLPVRGTRLQLESLESRDVPTTLIGLTTTGNLVRFDSASPGTLSGNPVAVTGLFGGETLVGIDYRPATNTLYGVGSNSRLYLIDPTTGAAGLIGGTFTPNLSGFFFGVDFNPASDGLRITSDSGQSLRIDPTTGTVPDGATDGVLTFDPNDPANLALFGTPPGQVITPFVRVIAAAYTSRVNPSNSTVSTLFGIDANQELLVRIGGVDGNPSPNGGQVVVVARLRDANTLAPANFASTTAFDIEANTNRAFAVSGTTLSTVDLTTGLVTPIGFLTGPFTLRDLAVVPTESAIASVQFDSTALTFSPNRTALAVTVTRTGGSFSTETVNFSTSDGTAIAGLDYLPSSGTLTFLPGQTTQTIVLNLPAGNPSTNPAKTFTLSLSNPSGGVLGTRVRATVTIPAFVAGTVPAPSRFFAVGSGAGSRVGIYDANGGGLAFNFSALNDFVGAAIVTTGDVNGDGVEDLIVGAGRGGGPRITVYNGATLSSTNQTPLADFFAFESTFSGGVTLATGDVNGDGFADLIVGAGPSGGPRVDVFDGFSLSSGTLVQMASFFAFNADFSGGVTVAVGDLNGDGFADLAIGADAGGGPRVRALDGQSLLSGNLNSLLDFFAFSTTFTGGVSVAVGDLNGDGQLDIIAGAGAGGGPNVRSFDGRTGTENGGIFAFATNFSGGVRVASVDLNSDGIDDLVVAAGAGGGPQVRALNLQSGVELTSFFAFDPSFTRGVYVG